MAEKRRKPCINQGRIPLERVTIANGRCAHCQKEWTYDCERPEIGKCTRWHQRDGIQCCQDCEHYDADG